MLLLVTTVSVAAAVTAIVYAWQLARRERLRSDARVAALASAAEDGGDGAPTPSMFARAGRSGLPGRPLLKAGVGVAMAVAVTVLIAMSGERHRTDVAVREIDPAPAPGSLELLSMRHSRSGSSLTVTGLVRSTATAGTPVTAVIFIFDREGGFVASGRAALEFGAIANGDESPFRVTIPDISDVGRYLISFRTATGVVPHVDRRPALQVSSAN